MRIEDFLEKQEKRELQLVSYLIRSGGEAEYTELEEHLGITKASLETTLESIAYSLRPLSENITLNHDGKTVYLWMEEWFSMRELQHFYLKQSVKVQLLDYLFRNHEFSLTQLAPQLALSESSLSRKIKELNRYLKEFELKIWNGRVQGEELQIRYFYYLFYRFVQGKEALKEREAGISRQIVQTMENYLQVSFEPENQARVFLWLQIAQHRMHTKKNVSVRLKENMTPYMEDKLYQKIRSMLWRFSSRYSVEPDEEDAQMLFVFLLSSGVLPEPFFHDYRLTRNRNSPAASLDTYLVETIIIQYGYRKLPYMLERRMYHTLSQIHAALYFFKGDLEVHDRLFLLEQEQKIAEESVRSFAETLREITVEKLKLPNETNNGLMEWSLLGYFSVLVMVTMEMRQVLRVGIDLKHLPMYRETAISLLGLLIEKVNGVEAEERQPDKPYDLIVTDRRVAEPPETGGKVYVLSELFSPFDQKNIERILQSLKK